MIDTGSDRGIGGGIWPAPQALQSFVQLFVAVDDVDEYLAKAEKLGGTVVIPKQVLPEGDEMAVLLDPEGMCVALAKEKS
jgi:predicted enzyme related to lactoylglutathione lyase